MKWKNYPYKGKITRWKNYPYKVKTNGDTSYIRITKQNKETFEIIVDTEDLPKILPLRWSMVRTNRLYVTAHVPNYDGKLCYLHHFVISPPPNLPTSKRNASRPPRQEPVEQ